MRQFIIFLLSGGLLIIHGTAYAGDHERARQLMEQGNIVSAEALLEQVKKIKPGSRLLELEIERDDGRYVYEVEVVDQQGKVWEFYFDAADGTLLRQEQED